MTMPFGQSVIAKEVTKASCDLLGLDPVSKMIVSKTVGWVVATATCDHHSQVISEVYDVVDGASDIADTVSDVNDSVEAATDLCDGVDSVSDAVDATDGVSDGYEIDYDRGDMQRSGDLFTSDNDTTTPGYPSTEKVIPVGTEVHLKDTGIHSEGVLDHQDAADERSSYASMGKHDTGRVIGTHYINGQPYEKVSIDQPGSGNIIDIPANVLEALNSDN